MPLSGRPHNPCVEGRPKPNSVSAPTVKSSHEQEGAPERGRGVTQGLGCPPSRAGGDQNPPESTSSPPRRGALERRVDDQGLIISWSDGGRGLRNDHEVQPTEISPKVAGSASAAPCVRAPSRRTGPSSGHRPRVCRFPEKTSPAPRHPPAFPRRPTPAFKTARNVVMAMVTPLGRRGASPTCAARASDLRWSG